MNSWTFNRYPSIPVAGIGVGYLAVAVVHFLRFEHASAATTVESVLLATLSTGFFYGTYRLSKLDLDPRDGVRVLGWILAAAFVGLVVGGTLVEMQRLDGVAIENVPILLATASAATGTVGLGVTEYRERLIAEQDALRDQNVAIARLHRRLTVLNRVLRHNLRNETSIIRGYAELLEESVIDRDRGTVLRTIVSHAERVDRLSRQAKRINRVWEVDAIVETDLTDVVEDSVERVSIDYDVDDVTLDLPESAVAAVHPHFEFAVEEAVENAVRHNDASTDVHVSLDGPSSGTFELDVADTGGGIADDEIDALRDGSEDSLTHGSGLGLWLIYWTVALSNGELSFEENDPRGTIVEMAVPEAA